MNVNVKHNFNHKKDLINKHLKYLYESDTSVILRIQAIEFLYPYMNEENILEKFKYFYQKERDLYIKTILQKAINGKLESYIVTDFRESESQYQTSQVSRGSTQRLSLEELALLKVSSFS